MHVYIVTIKRLKNRITINTWAPINIKIVTKEEKKYACVYCYYKTFKKQDYNKHLGTHKHKNSYKRGKKYACVYCDYKTFKNRITINTWAPVNIKIVTL